MKGLLLKDYYILRSQKKMFAMFLLIALMFLITNDNPTSGVSYCLFITAFLSLSTISYDDLDNGLQFLFTLPPGRKTYVASKYLFCLINSMAAWFVLSFLGTGINVVRGNGDISFIFPEMFLLLCTCLILIGIMMPLHLKYGAEKTRVVLLLFVGICVIGGFFLDKLSVNLDGLVMPLQNLTLPMACIYFAIAAVAVYGVSYACSIRVVMGKEF